MGQRKAKGVRLAGQVVEQEGAATRMSSQRRSRKRARTGTRSREAVLRGCPDESRRNHTWTFYSKVISWKQTELTQATMWEAIFHSAVSVS